MDTQKIDFTPLTRDITLLSLTLPQTHPQPATTAGRAPKPTGTRVDGYGIGG